MSDILEGLNPSQLKAVTHQQGPLLIVAGAGTGKTTVLARRYAWFLAERGLTSENILALTFTEKSAQEMEDRVLQLVPNGTYDFWISTFHGFCQRILEERALEIGLPNRFRLLNETDAWLLLKRKITELPLDHYRPLGNPVKFLGGLLKHISRAKDEGVTAEQYQEFAKNCVLAGDPEFVAGERKRLKELADCYFEYRRILRGEDALDFGDLIVEALRLMRERPAVLKEFRERFKVIMVDEFQDTNWAQYELVKLLAGNEKNLTVVGDDDQAIYKFRGASLANILQFRDDFPQAVTVALTENYRSRQEILDTAYNFIKKNDPYRLEVKLADTGLTKKLSASRGTGGSVNTKWFRTLEEEAENVAGEIRALKDKDPELSWNDIAILVRSNDGATPFVITLERHGIPFRFFALRGLYGKPIIVDLISILKVCDGYHDSTAMWRVASMPSYGFTARDLSELLHYANLKSISLWGALKKAPLISSLDEEGRKRASTLVSHIENLAETAKRATPLKFLQLALEKTRLLSYILSLSEGERIEQINLLNTFANRIKRYELTTHGPTLKSFLEELQLEIDSGEEGALNADLDSGPELVKIMTIHASKGLEFKHVFLVSMVDQRFPTRERVDAIPLPNGLINERLPEGDAHMEEERRLLYVAMTRAKDTLTLTGASGYGGTRKKKPSVFFEEAKLEVDLKAINSDELSSLTVAEVLTENEKAEREVFKLKKRFSFTQIAAFRTCPLQYKFAHVYKIPILGSHHKSFGQSIHHTFHEILKRNMDRGLEQQGDLFGSQVREVAVGPNGFRVPLEEALKIYEEKWIDEWYETRARHDEYKQVGEEAVKTMWRAWDNQPPKIRALEQQFEWRLGEQSIKGAIDRIDEMPDGSVAIYDYKTGQPKTSDDLESKDKEQLRIYQLALEGRGIAVSKLAYVYVRNGEEALVDVLAGEKKVKFEEEIVERMRNILVSKYLPQPSPFICRSCDFRNICEFRKL